MIERDGSVLIGQRKRTDPHPLKWEFPGGKVEPGETRESALSRELREELAIHVVSATEMVRYTYQYPPNPRIELVFYRVIEFEGEPENLAFERIEWTPPARLSEYDFLEGDLEFIRRYSDC